MLTDWLDESNMPYERDALLAPLMWYRVGGPAKVLARPRSVQQLAALVAHCHENRVPVYALGSGANLLVADRGVDGVVVKLDDPAFCSVSYDGPVVTAAGGVDLMKLVLDTAKRGLGGLEGLAGIPATIGGAVRMNAGGTYGQIGAAVKRIHVMDVAGHVYYRERDDLIFSYRKVNLTAKFILSVEFELTVDDPDELVKRVKEVFLYKKNTQPMGDNSAGCAFKNPTDEATGQTQSAGRLIDMAGLKGYQVGGACVSNQHANFIITDDHATASDILNVIEHVEQTVEKKFAIQLQREIVVWP